MEVVLLLTLGSIATAAAFLFLFSALGVVWARMRYYKSLVTGEEYVEKESLIDRLKPSIKTAGDESRRFLANLLHTIWRTTVVLCVGIFVLTSTTVLSFVIIGMIDMYMGWGVYEGIFYNG